MNILEKIAEAIYWKSFTQKQKDFILNTLAHDDTEMGKANDICDFLGIERRGNRQAIYIVLINIELGDLPF